MQDRRFVLPVILVLAIGVGLVCAQGSGDAAAGKKLFMDSGEDLEYPSCSHCHATVQTSEELKKTGHIRPAFPVFDTSGRGAWKNNAAGKGPATAGDAGNICVRAFQKRQKLPASDIADLNAFLATVSPGKAEPRKIQYAPAIPESLDGGNAEEGKKKVEVFCGTCHGASDDHLQFELKAGRKPKLKVAMKVRGWVEEEGKRKFKANNGMMSFFAKDRLSDEDLLDILAYVGK